MQLFEDRVGCGGPGEGLAGLVVGGDEVVDLADQILDRRERTSANRLVRDQAEETLDLIEPRAIASQLIVHSTRAWLIDRIPTEDLVNVGPHGASD
ncbi:hypothetical protein D3C85_1369150 [compost metagenome]